MIIEDIKESILHYQKKFEFSNKTKQIWSHGFICGLYDRDLITNIQFEELLDWLE